MKQPGKGEGRNNPKVSLHSCISNFSAVSCYTIIFILLEYQLRHAYTDNHK